MSFKQKTNGKLHQCFVYILKTKIDNALTQIGTYSTSVFLVKYELKKS